ncbi:MAG TPA: endolytic transglycosylase MltG [Flavobacteriales bacterium]|nr:endolytic transglycosylase MltG [Flavobacteriales bacterium]HRN36993.1 endolytic transglycosylase MltG [Flavobacteriales bacterium]HRO39379.1 endolytic transglycosylase MltG [Flavobacteriales bacterium]HRP81970.1 endolytic transglycosylase MltG [Flavobacteriales bacterium]HRQ84059.1 endolytic transglycosylase MltG [Flavobacteriales bacterium]
MKKAFLTLGLLILVVGGYYAWRTWKKVYGPATGFAGKEQVLLIPTGAEMVQVQDSLQAGNIVSDIRLFRWVATRKKYERIRPGRYVVPKGMSMNDLVNKLRSGDQDPVRITFNNIRNLPQLAGQMAKYIQSDSLEVLTAIMDPATIRKLGFNQATIISLFLPNTYEVWWTTTPDQLIDRMAKEYKQFWNDERRAKADALGLTQSEVSTLASIVQAETGKTSDAPKIASVYLNRLRIGMPLQADPTLVYALGLDSLNRVLHNDKRVDSPYNTYTHAGLPPGPINLPEPRFIDAVLSPAKTDYLYFCAREDLSGYSNFSTTYQQHLVNARRYQQALNKRGIYR